MERCPRLKLVPGTPATGNGEIWFVAHRKVNNFLHNNFFETVNSPPIELCRAISDGQKVPLYSRHKCLVREVYISPDCECYSTSRNRSVQTVQSVQRQLLTGIITPPFSAPTLYLTSGPRKHSFGTVTALSDRVRHNCCRCCSTKLLSRLIRIKMGF